MFDRQRFSKDVFALVIAGSLAGSPLIAGCAGAAAEGAGGACNGGGQGAGSNASAPASPPPPSVCSIELLAQLPSPKLDRSAAGPSRENLRAWVSVLANPALRGRRGGSAENQMVASMLARELLAAGMVGPPSDGEMCRHFELHGIADQNVAAHFHRIGHSNREGGSIGAQVETPAPVT